MARNLRRFHAHQIKNAGRRYYDKSLVAQKLVLEKELQYPQNILPFLLNHLSVCITLGVVQAERFTIREIKMRLLHLKPHARHRRPVF